VCVRVCVCICMCASIWNNIQYIHRNTHTQTHTVIHTYSTPICPDETHSNPLFILTTYTPKHTRKMHTHLLSLSLSHLHTRSLARMLAHTLFLSHTHTTLLLRVFTHAYNNNLHSSRRAVSRSRTYSPITYTTRHTLPTISLTNAASESDDGVAPTLASTIVFTSTKLLVLVCVSCVNVSMLSLSYFRGSIRICLFYLQCKDHVGKFGVFLDFFPCIHFDGYYDEY